MKRQVSLAEEFQIVYEGTERVRGEGLHSGEAAKGSSPQQLEKARVQQQRPSPAKNKNNNKQKLLLKTTLLLEVSFH